MNHKGMVRLWASLDPVALVGTLWVHRNLMRQITLRELTARYRGTYLGILWSLLVPLLMMAVYTFVFSVIFKARWRPDSSGAPGTCEFALAMFAGLSAFNVFSEVVNRAPGVIVANPNYVKKVVFPLEILPVVAVASAVIQSLISAALVVIGGVLLLHHLPSTLILLPLAYLPLIFLALGLGWILAALGVYIRDVAQVMGVAVQVLFFLSPVFYPVASIPERLRPLMMLNPLTSILESFRQVLLWGDPLNWGLWGGWTAGTFCFALLGHAWFAATRKGFADVI